MKDSISLLVCFLLFTFTACKEDPPSTTQDCEKKIVIDDTKYNGAKDESDFSIRNVSITGNCMDVTYNYGGGCGEIRTELIASEQSVQNTMELPSRFLKLSIDDQDPCEAMITVTESFKISALQNEANQVYIKLHKWDSLITYSY